MNSNGIAYEQWRAEQGDETHVNEGEICPNKDCGGVILVSYNMIGHDGDYAKTWECQKCGDTWSE